MKYIAISLVMMGITFIVLMNFCVSNPNVQLTKQFMLADKISFIACDGCYYLNDGKDVSTITDMRQIDEIRRRLTCKTKYGLYSTMCSCLGNAAIRLWKNGQVVYTVGIQHNQALRIDGVQGDSELTNEAKTWLVKYLTSIGIR
jgi:hypothetical protein